MRPNSPNQPNTPHKLLRAVAGVAALTMSLPAGEAHSPQESQVGTEVASAPVDSLPHDLPDLTIPVETKMMSAELPEPVPVIIKTPTYKKAITDIEGPTKIVAKKPNDDQPVTKEPLPVLPDTSEEPIPPVEPTVDIGTPVVPDESILFPGLIGPLPEAKPISAETARRLKENTVYLPSSGCSGYLIRNNEGKAIGAMTAEHCGLRDIFKERKTDENGNYVEAFAPFSVMQGEDLNNMAEVGKVGTIIVPPKGDISQDFAVLVFEGENPDEVYGAINELPVLQVGDTAYLSGFPVDQDYNTSGVMRRQQWPMTYIGSMEAPVTSGELLSNVQIFALKSNEDGAECSFGDSGGVAVLEDGTVVGVLAIFNEFVPDTWQKDFESAEAARAYYSQLFSVDLTGYTNICGFSTKQPITSMEQYKVRVNDPNAEWNKEQARLLAIEQKIIVEFNDETKAKTFVDGWIKTPFYSPNKGGPGSDTKPWVENPFAYVDEVSGDLFLYWRNDETETGFNFYPLIANSYPYVEVTRELGADAATALELTSGAMTQIDYEGNPAFQDADGSIAGNLSDSPPTENEIQYLSVVDGKPFVTTGRK